MEMEMETGKEMGMEMELAMEDRYWDAFNLHLNQLPEFQAVNAASMQRLTSITQRAGLTNLQLATRGEVRARTASTLTICHLQRT